MRHPFLLSYPWEETTICLISDFHANSPDFNNKAWEQDKQRIIDMNARVLLGGDTDDYIFHLDKRFSSPRYQHKNSNIIQGVVKKTIKEKFDGILDRIEFIGVGNHETSVMKYYLTDPVYMMIQEIKEATGKEPIHGGYTGMFRIEFKEGKHLANETWYYHHGAGGNAPVTKGMIDFNRLRTQYWADVYWIQHKHNDISDQPMRTRLNRNLNYEYKKVLCVIAPGYNNKRHSDDYNDHGGYTLNWGEEKFYPSQPAGSSFITYKPYNKNGKDCLERRLIKFN